MMFVSTSNAVGTDDARRKGGDYVGTVRERSG
jgi:hypothetical protein